MKKLLLIIGILFCFISFVSATGKPDETPLAKTAHSLALTTFEKFNYFPLETMLKSEGFKITPTVEFLESRYEVKDGNILAANTSGIKKCWQCYCTKCGWSGNVHGCSNWNYPSNPCGGWNCPIHGCCPLQTRSWPCEPDGSCYF